MAAILNDGRCVPHLHIHSGFHFRNVLYYDDNYVCQLTQVYHFLHDFSLIGWTIEAFMLIIIFANVELTQFLNLSFHLLIHADGFKGKA